VMQVMQVMRHQLKQALEAQRHSRCSVAARAGTLAPVHAAAQEQHMQQRGTSKCTDGTRLACTKAAVAAAVWSLQAQAGGELMHA